MKVVYTDESLRDVDDILTFVAAEFPTAYRPIELRLQAIERRIGQWPESAQEVAERTGVRMGQLARNPYKIFYQVTREAVEVLHIHRAAGRNP